MQLVAHRFVTKCACSLRAILLHKKGCTSKLAEKYVKINNMGICLLIFKSSAAMPWLWGGRLPHKSVFQLSDLLYARRIFPDVLCEKKALVTNCSLGFSVKMSLLFTFLCDSQNKNIIMFFCLGIAFLGDDFCFSMIFGDVFQKRSFPIFVQSGRLHVLLNIFV